MKINLKKEHKDLIKKSNVYICENCKKEIKEHEQLRGTLWKENGEVKREYRHVRRCHLT